MDSLGHGPSNDLVIGPRRSPLCTRRSSLCTRRPSLGSRRSWFGPCLSWGVELGLLPSPWVWEDLLPHVEFAYNRVVNSTTSHSPFEVVYGFNRLTPLDLLPIPILDDVLCKDGVEKASFIKKFA